MRTVLTLLTLTLSINALAMNDYQYKNAKKAIRLADEVRKKGFTQCAKQAVNALDNMSEANTDLLNDCIKIARKQGKLERDLKRVREALR